MNSSHAYRQSAGAHTSLAESLDLFTCDPNDLTPGSLNDEFLVRGVITRAIKNCSKSRDTIAEEMTTLLGSKVTRRALDSYTSESADQNRWPAQYTRAFCYVTGDWTLVRCVAELAGLHTITKAERKLLELGRQTIIQKRAAATIAKLEQELAEVQL